jgi:hypothetical protein
MDEYKNWEIVENEARLKPNVKPKSAYREAMKLLKQEIDLYLQISKRNVNEIWYSDKEIHAYLTTINSKIKINTIISEKDLYECIEKSINFMNSIKNPEWLS